MILFTIFGSFWLEIVLKTRVLARLRRALIAILPVSSIFLIWDFYAVSRDHWDFDADQTLGINGPLEIPLEEFLSSRGSFSGTLDFGSRAKRQAKVDRRR